MKALWPLKLTISVIALGALVARLLWPALRLDAISLGLMGLGVLPWLSDLIESAKLPGGLEIKFRDLKDAGEKVVGVALAPTAAPGDGRFLGLSLDHDPNLALVELRIEIERRLRALAQLAGISASSGIVSLLRQLRDAGLLDYNTFSGLKDIVDYGNDAAHGAKIEPQVLAWVRQLAPEVLAVLDAKLLDQPNNGPAAGG